MNSYLISFSSPVENEGEDTSYKIFASESFVMPFKVLAVIAVDLHFDECFSFQSWGMEYFRSGGGTTAAQFRVRASFQYGCAAVCFCRKHSLCFVDSVVFVCFRKFKRCHNATLSPPVSVISNYLVTLSTSTHTAYHPSDLSSKHLVA